MNKIISWNDSNPFEHATEIQHDLNLVTLRRPNATF